MIQLIPVETKVTRDSFENNQAFVRRGQTVYVIREMPDGKFLVQSTASLEVKSISVECIDSAHMVHTKPTQNVKLVTKACFQNPDVLRFRWLNITRTVVLSRIWVTLFYSEKFPKFSFSKTLIFER